MRSYDAEHSKLFHGYGISTTTHTNNRVRYKVLKFIFTSLGINNYDKPTAPENFLDYIDAR